MSRKEKWALISAFVFLIATWSVGDAWLTVFVYILFFAVGVPWEIRNLTPGATNGNEQ